MSDDGGYISSVGFDAPTGRKLEGLGGDKRAVGTIGLFQPASPELLDVLRRKIREIDDDDLEQRGQVFVDRESSEELEIARCLVIRVLGGGES